MPDNSVDSIVTDPPYGLSFMGKKWDYDVPKVDIWKEVLRVLKPGGHLLSFAGSRTYHRMAVNIEDAGFEIRDQIMWVYGSGFPKSHNIGKSVDKLQGNEREVVGKSNGAGKLMEDRPWNKNPEYDKNINITKGSSPYEGWGTALKPAHEPIVVARKPLSESTIAENVLKWGTGGLNIDASRVEGEAWKSVAPNKGGRIGGILGKQTEHPGGDAHPQGRFPANFIHDGSDEVVGLFPDTKSKPRNDVGRELKKTRGITGMSGAKWTRQIDDYNDSGSASRFFYCAKASKKDRNEGLEGFEEKENAGSYEFRTDGSLDGKTTQAKANFHPTVKPTSLMQYLVRLVTPKGGTVLDPFMGSGSTGKACKLEGFDFIGIEMDAEYVKIADARINS